MDPARQRQSLMTSEFVRALAAAVPTQPTTPLEYRMPKLKTAPQIAVEDIVLRRRKDDQRTDGTEEQSTGAVTLEELKAISGHSRIVVPPNNPRTIKRRVPPAPNKQSNANNGPPNGDAQPADTNTSPADIVALPSAPLAVRPGNKLELLMFNQRKLRKVQWECAKLSDRLRSIERLVAELAEKQKSTAELPTNIAKRFSEITSKVYTLEKAFFTLDEKTIDEAATKINACVRGFLARQKYKRAKAALMNWRARELAQIRAFFLDWLHRRDLVYQKIDFLKSREVLRLVHDAFRAWAKLAKENAPRWRELKDREEQLHTLHMKYLCLQILRRWRDVAMGPQSRKAIRTAWWTRYRHAEKRVILKAEESKWKGALTTQMVKAEMDREAIEMMARRRLENLMRRCFTAWRQWVIDKKQQMQSQNKFMAAMRFFRHKTCRKILRAWAEHTRKMKELHGIERWRSRRNKFVAIYRARVNTLRNCFTRWRAYARPRAEARRRKQRKDRVLLGRVFYEFRARVQYQRQLKLFVLERMVLTPTYRLRLAFRAWHLWAVHKKMKDQPRQALLKAFVRRKKKLLMRQCFMAWRDYALISPEAASFGIAISRKGARKSAGEGTSGSNRSNDTSALLAELQDMRQENALLKQNVEKLTSLLQDFESAVEMGEVELKEKDELLKRKNEEVLDLRFAVHNARQEIFRLRSLIDNNFFKQIVNTKRLFELQQLLKQGAPPVPVSTGPPGAAAIGSSLPAPPSSADSFSSRPTTHDFSATTSAVPSVPPTRSDILSSVNSSAPASRSGMLYLSDLPPPIGETSMGWSESHTGMGGGDPMRELFEHERRHTTSPWDRERDTSPPRPVKAAPSRPSTVPEKASALVEEPLPQKRPYSPGRATVLPALPVRFGRGQPLDTAQYPMPPDTAAFEEYFGPRMSLNSPKGKLEMFLPTPRAEPAAVDNARPPSGAAAANTEGSRVSTPPTKKFTQEVSSLKKRLADLRRFLPFSADRVLLESAVSLPSEIEKQRGEEASGATVAAEDRKIIERLRSTLVELFMHTDVTKPPEASGGAPTGDEIQPGHEVRWREFLTAVEEYAHRLRIPRGQVLETLGELVERVASEELRKEHRKQGFARQDSDWSLVGSTEEHDEIFPARASTAGEGAESTRVQREKVEEDTGHSKTLDIDLDSEDDIEEH